MFPPTKVGGSVDWPWHDKAGCPVADMVLDYEFLAQINLEQVNGVGPYKLHACPPIA
jgi:hypothetical protein